MVTVSSTPRVTVLQAAKDRTAPATHCNTPACRGRLFSEFLLQSCYHQQFAFTAKFARATFIAVNLAANNARCRVMVEEHCVESSQLDGATPPVPHRSLALERTKCSGQGGCSG